MKKRFLLCALLLPSLCFGAQIKVHMGPADEGAPTDESVIGTITFEDTPFGLMIYPDLKDFAPGMHGFHVHENPSCEGDMKDGSFVPGLLAGGHLDPAGTNKHLGPFNVHGHLGDLPGLYCDSNGVCNTEMLAPKIKVKDMLNRSIIIHAHGDNYSDTPKPLGGGGARIACGVIANTSSK